MMCDCWMEYPNHDDLTRILKAESEQSREVSTLHVDAIEAFVKYVYYSKMKVYVIDFKRMKHFGHVAESNLRLLPPSMNGLKEHMKRAALQGGWLWKKAVHNFEHQDPCVYLLSVPVHLSFCVCLSACVYLLSVSVHLSFCVCLSACVYLSVCVCPSVLLCLSVFLCLFVCLCLSISPAVSVCLSACVYLSVCVCPPVLLCLSVCLPVSICLSVSVHLSFCVCLSVCLCLFVCLCLSICPSVSVCLLVSICRLCLSICPSVSGDHVFICYNMLNEKGFSPLVKSSISF